MMFELRVLDGLHQGAALPLFGQQWSIGAHAEADLVLSDPGIAERHAHLRLIDSNWSVQSEAGLLRDAMGQLSAQIASLAPNVFVASPVIVGVTPGRRPPLAPGQMLTCWLIGLRRHGLDLSMGSPEACLL